METEKVSLIKCEDYEQSRVDIAVKQAIDNLGGIENFVKPNQVVVLKANLVVKAVPEKACTTHPSVIEGIGKLCKQAGASRVIIADSAGGPFTAGYMGGICKAAGMVDVAERNGFEINDNFESFDVSMDDAKVGKKFIVLDCLQKADVIINVCKLKTHSFTGLSGAIKNMFGSIPGLTKVEMHGQFRTLDVFGDFLMDIQQYFKPKLLLHLVDAVVGMEGPGPTNGTPRQIGAIIAGNNPVAVDCVGAKLINLVPQEVPNIQTGIKRGWIDESLPIEVIGDEMDAIADYKTVVPNNFKPFANYIPKWLQPTIHRLTTRRPYISKRKCRGCKKCFEHCPAKAISMVPVGKDKPPKLRAQIDLSKCIRCYCCQELCPFGVVKIKSGIIYKILHIKSKHKKSK